MTQRVRPTDHRPTLAGSERGWEALRGARGRRGVGVGRGVLVKYLCCRASLAVMRLVGSKAIMRDSRSWASSGAFSVGQQPCGAAQHAVSLEPCSLSPHALSDALQLQKQCLEGRTCCCSDREA